MFLSPYTFGSSVMYARTLVLLPMPLQSSTHFGPMLTIALFLFISACILYRAGVAQGGGQSGEYMPLAFRVPVGSGSYSFLGLADVVGERQKLACLTDCIEGARLH